MAEKETYLERKARRKAARAKKENAKSAVTSTPSVEVFPEITAEKVPSYIERKRLRKEARINGAKEVIKQVEQQHAKHNVEWDSGELQHDLDTSKATLPKKRGFPSSVGERNINKDAPITGAKLARGAAWMFRPLGAIQTAALAPIAAQDYKYPANDPRNLAHAFEVMGKTFFKEIGVNGGSERENIERGVLNYVFGEEGMESVPPVLRNTAEVFLGVFSDPASLVFVPAFRKVVMKSLATAAAENRAPKVFGDTVREMYTFEGAPRKAGNVKVNTLADEADLGSQEAAEELANKIKSNVEKNVKKKTNIPTELKAFIGEPPKKGGGIEKLGDFGDENQVWTSKKGTEYIKKNGYWFDLDGKQVTNFFKMKAIRKGLLDEQLTFVSKPIDAPDISADTKAKIDAAALKKIDDILGTTQPAKPAETLADKAKKAKVDKTLKDRAELVEGFVTPKGKFLTKPEAAELVNLKGANISSEDLKLLGNTKLTPALKDKQGRLWTGANHGEAFENMNANTAKTKKPTITPKAPVLKPLLKKIKPKEKPKVIIRRKKIGIPIPKPNTATKAVPWSKLGAPAVIDKGTGEVLAGPPSMKFDFRPSRTEGVEENVKAFQRLRKEMGEETPLDQIGMGFMSKDGQTFIPSKVQEQAFEKVKATTKGGKELTGKEAARHKSVQNKAKIIQNELKRQIKKRMKTEGMLKNMSPIKAVHRLVYKSKGIRDQAATGAKMWWKANPDLRKGLTFEDIKRAAQEAVWTQLRHVPAKTLKAYHKGDKKVMAKIGSDAHRTAIWAAKNYAAELLGQPKGVSRYTVKQQLDAGTFKNVKSMDEGYVPDLRDNITDPEVLRLSRMGMDPEDIMEGQEAIATANKGDIRPRPDERLKKEVKRTMPKKGKAVVLGQKELSKRARKNKRKRMYARKVEAMRKKKLINITKEEHAKITAIEEEISKIRKQDQIDELKEIGKRQDVVPHAKDESKIPKLPAAKKRVPVQENEPILTRQQRAKLKKADDKYEKDIRQIEEKKQPESELQALNAKADEARAVIVKQVVHKINRKRDRLVRKYKRQEDAANLSIKNKEPQSISKRLVEKAVKTRHEMDAIDKFLGSQKRLNQAAMELRLRREVAYSAAGAKNAGQSLLYSGVDPTLAKKLLLDPVFQGWTRGVDKLGGKAAAWLRTQTLKSDTLSNLAAYTIEEFGLDETYKMFRKEYDQLVHNWETMASDYAMVIKEIDGNFDQATKTIKVLGKDKVVPARTVRVSREAGQMRAKQVAGGSLTSFNNKFKAVLEAQKDFKQLEKMLKARGLLEDHQFHRLTNKELKKITGYKAKGQKNWNSGSLRALKQEYDETIDKIVELNKRKDIDPNYDLKLKNLHDNAEALDLLRIEATTRLQIHYKNAGKTYFRQIANKMKNSENALRNFNTMGMNKQWNIRRDNWDVSLKPGTTQVEIKAKGMPLKAGSVDKMLELDKLVHKGITDEAKDAFMFDLFKKIYDRKEWKGSAKKKGFVKMENNPDKWGPLAGKYIPIPIHRELKSTYAEIGAVGKVLKPIMTKWKSGKTIWSPRTQVRNLLSNAVLADVIADMPITTSWGRYASGMHDFTKMIRSTSKDSDLLDPVTKAFKYDTTLSKSTYSANELASHMEVFSDETMKKILGSSDGSAALVKYIQKSKNAPKYVFRMVEEGMKLAIFRKKIEDGLKALNYKNLDDMTKPEKAKLVAESEMVANAALFDYSKVPGAIRAARIWYSPFITFSYKAIPGLAKAFARKPWKAAKYFGALYMIEKQFEKWSGKSEDEIEREKRALPHYMQREMLPGQPSHMMMPFTFGEGGETEWFDLSFILPWGAATDMTGDLSMVPQVIAPTNPVFTMAWDMLANENMFLQKPLTFKHDTKMEIAGKLVKHFMNSAQPGFVDAIRKTADKLAFRPYYGIAGSRKNDYARVLLDTMFGLKFRNHEYLIDVMNRNRELTKRKSEIVIDFVQQTNEVMFKKGLKGEKARQEQQKNIVNMSEDLRNLFNDTMYLYNVENEEL